MMHIVNTNEKYYNGKIFSMYKINNNYNNINSLTISYDTNKS